MSVRHQVEAAKTIRSEKIPTDASDQFKAGWNAAFEALFSSTKVFDLMPKASIVVEVTIEAAEKFIRQMADTAHEPVKDAVSTDQRESWYFKRDGVTSIQHEVTIDRESEQAFISVRPS